MFIYPSEKTKQNKIQNKIQNKTNTTVVTGLIIHAFFWDKI